jgi:hypothetical protein
MSPKPPSAEITGGSRPHERSSSIISNASRHFGSCLICSGTCARRRRSSSVSHSSGRNRRQSSGQDAASVAALTDTPTWQLATLPSAPQYWCATPTECRPNFGKPVSSTIHTSGPISRCIRRASRALTGSQAHGDWLTNCCRHCSSPSGSRSAIGSIDLRRPSSISPRKYTSPQRRWSLRRIGTNISSANSTSRPRTRLSSRGRNPAT